MEFAHVGRERHRIGVGRPDQHFDAMPESRELAREEPQIDPLAAAAHVAAVGGEEDAQRPTHATRLAYSTRLFGQIRFISHFSMRSSQGDIVALIKNSR